MATIEIRDVLDNETGKTIFPRTHVDAVIGLKDFSFFEERVDPNDATKKYIQLKEEYTGLASLGWMAAGGIGRGGGGGGGLISSVYGKNELGSVYSGVPTDEDLTKTFSAYAIDYIYKSTLQSITTAQDGKLNFNFRSGDTIVVDLNHTHPDLSAAIASIHSLELVVVQSLPTASASTMEKIYLVPSPNPVTQNIKDEYITVRSGSEGSYTYSWEQIGTTAVDLSGYVQKTQKVNGHALSGDVTVTKSDIGLGNVENTKLSTWAGTTNVTTLGTITTGTWNASIIGVTKGGTGLTSIAQGEMLYGSAQNTIGKVSANGTATKMFLSQTGSNAPAWGTISYNDLPALYARGTQILSGASTGLLYGVSGLSYNYSDFSGTDYSLISWNGNNGSWDLAGNLSLQSAKHISIGPVTISYDSTNHGLHISGTYTDNNETKNLGFYCDGWVAAGGIGQGGGQGIEYSPGTGLSLTGTEFSLKVASNGEIGGVRTGYTTDGTNRNYAVLLDSNNKAYVNVPWTGGSGGGTLSSVGLSMPQGFSVSGSPLTADGTITVSFDTGYSLPTTAKQSEWDAKQNALSWGTYNDTAKTVALTLGGTQYILCVNGYSAGGGISSESDPVFSNSAAYNITSTDIANWNGKANKVSNATNGNFAALDSNGNLTDSGHKHSDYLTSHQSVSLASGTNNGTLKLTVGSAVTDNIAVKGLGSLAYKSSLSASDIPDLSGTYLTSHQTIYTLTLSAGTFSSGTWNPATAAGSVSIPTTLDHIGEGTTRKLSDYVTLETAQTISGAKTFSADLTLGGNLALASNKHIDLGPIRIEYDATNKALHITKKDSNDTETYGLYADGFVAAGGVQQTS